MSPKKPKSPGAVPPAPPKSAARRLATKRDFGMPVWLVALFRAPPPVHVVAGKMWIDVPTRRVTVLGSLGNIPSAPRKMIAVRRTHAWVAYVDRCEVDAAHQPGLVTTGPLDPRERDIVWAWGWKSKAAKALQVMEALW